MQDIIIGGAIVIISLGVVLWQEIYYRKQLRKSAEQKMVIDESKKRDAEILQMLRKQGRA